MRKVCRVLLLLACQLLWVMGFVAGLSGIFLLMKYRQSSLFFSHSYIILPAALTLACAVFLLATGFLGTCISFKQSTFLLGLFVFLLVVVFCLGSTASALAYFHSKKLESEIAPPSQVFQKYTGSSQDPYSQAVDTTQEEFRCCGVHDYRDWLKTPWFNSTGGLRFPHSCCNSTFPSCNGTVDQPWELNAQGCQVELETTLQVVLSLILWGFTVVFPVEVVVLVTVAQLMKYQSLVEYQILDWQ
uniref:Tetraspanin n=1 Tax=Monopterus albus TaxID=43700 RepID=A0A3Q3JJG4_MONAL|nr:tetraspanin-3-like [Monopterus albus]